MEILASFLILIAFLASFHPLREIPDEELILYQESVGIERSFRYEVKPLTAFVNENVVEQQFDYSCGSAALATILNYHLGENLTEQQVIQGMMEYGDIAMIEKRRAFSLLDMKQFVGVLGYKGAGYVANIDDLRALDKPCIIPIVIYGYNHFVVFRGIYGDHVFFADPNLGNVSFTISEFKNMWHKNIIFLVTDGGVSTDALLLGEDDLRIVAFEMTGTILQEDNPPALIIEERRLMESTGKYIFLNVNVK